MQPPSGTCNSQSVWMHPRSLARARRKGQSCLLGTPQQQLIISGEGRGTHLLQPYGEVIMIKSSSFSCQKNCRAKQRTSPPLSPHTSAHGIQSTVRDASFSPRRRCTDLEMADRKDMQKRSRKAVCFGEKGQLSNYHPNQPCVGFTYCFLDGPFFSFSFQLRCCGSNQCRRLSHPLAHTHHHPFSVFFWASPLFFSFARS